MKKQLWVCYRLILKDIENKPIKVLVAEDLDITDDSSLLNKKKLARKITSLVTSELKAQRTKYPTKNWLIAFRIFDDEILLPSGNYDCRQTIYDAVYEVLLSYEN